MLKSRQVPNRKGSQKLLTAPAGVLFGFTWSGLAFVMGGALVGCGASGGSGQGAISGVRLNHGGSSHTGGLE